MAGILLNLLAATAGGQITRAEAFLRRFRAHAPDVRLVVVKERDALHFCEGVADWELINVRIGAGRMRALRRMAWENLALSQLMKKERLNVYLTFSHYLPLGLGEQVYSVVGVSNLAPFSTAAWEAEHMAVRSKMWLLKKLIVSSAKRADRVVALSQACKSILEGCDVNTEKIVVIPNGVEVDWEETTTGTSGGDAIGSLYVLSVSHFHRYKNFHCLLNAYVLLPDRIKKKFKLVIIGKPYDRTYYSEILDYVGKLKLTERVIVVPGMDKKQLSAMYRNASLFVFTSLIENSPNILLEAMAYGLPIVSSDVEPMPEFGSSALHYFKAHSPEDLASKMADILSEPRDAIALGLRAQRRAADFSWDRFTRNVVGICESFPGTTYSVRPRH